MGAPWILWFGTLNRTDLGVSQRQVQLEQGAVLRWMNLTPPASVPLHPDPSPSSALNCLQEGSSTSHLEIKLVAYFSRVFQFFTIKHPLQIELNQQQRETLQGQIFSGTRYLRGLQLLSKTKPGQYTNVKERSEIEKKIQQKSPLAFNIISTRVIKEKISILKINFL